jgi:hypothetical protein
VSALRFVSPERHWRAALLVVPSAWLGWGVYQFFGTVAGCVVGAALLSLAIPTMRTSLTVTGDELIDKRALRTVRVAWPQIAGFRVGRPGGLWDGFCVIAACHDETQVDLLSTRVYSRSPSARHLEELHATCETLRGLLATNGEPLTYGP